MNKCTLEGNKVALAYLGPCDNDHWKPHNPALVCDCKFRKFKPVCSLAGYTFENECVLNCTHQIHQSKGPCLTPCDCEKKYRPVCGVDGLTYDNKCTAQCVGVQILGNGECPSIMRSCKFCSKVFMPTCGEKNITYRNLCELKCNKSKFVSFGKCR